MEYKVLIGQEIDQILTIRIMETLAETFRDTDRIFNKWNPQSELSKLNAQKAEVSTPLSPHLLRLFKETDQIVKLSQGKFDPTIEPLQHLWKQKLKTGTVPNHNEIQTIAPAIGWDKISFAQGYFRKEHDLTQLDFGGIAKGLCIDLIVERLNEAGISSLYVEWGGEIRVCGCHPQGRPWTVYITHLEDTDPDHAIATLSLNDQAIATSGDYLQNWPVKLSDHEENGRIATYFHIFDPATLQPFEITEVSIASVSVVAPSCALADGLATVPMMFSSSKEATEWANTIKEKFPEISFWIVSRTKFI